MRRFGILETISIRFCSAKKSTFHPPSMPTPCLPQAYFKCADFYADSGMNHLSFKRLRVNNDEFDECGDLEGERVWDTPLPTHHARLCPSSLLGSRRLNPRSCETAKSITAKWESDFNKKQATGRRPQATVNTQPKKVGLKRFFTLAEANAPTPQWSGLPTLCATTWLLTRSVRSPGPCKCY